MNRAELLATLKPDDGDSISLNLHTQALGPLALHLRDLLAKDGTFVLKDVQVEKAGKEPLADSRLVLHADASVHGVSRKVKAVFELDRDGVRSFYFVVKLPQKRWTLADAVALPKLRDDRASLVKGLSFQGALLVLAANQRLITDAEFQLDREPFANGLHLFARGLTSATNLRLALQSETILPRFQSLVPRPDRFGELDRVKGPLRLNAGFPEIILDLWFTVNDQGKSKKAHFTRAGLSVWLGLGPAGGFAVGHIGELDTPDGPIELFAETRANHAPIYRAEFPAARHLAHGMAGLAPFYDDEDLSAELPLPDEERKRPTIHLEAIEYRPNEWMHTRVRLIEAGSDKPWSFSAFDGAVVVREVSLEIDQMLDGSKARDFEIAGITDVFGLTWDARLRTDTGFEATLREPHTIAVNSLLHNVTGVELGLPVRDVTVVGATLAMDPTSRSHALALALGGRIDLLDGDRLALTGIAFDVAVENGKVVDRSFSARLRFAGIDLTVTASEDSGAGWVLQAAAAAETKVDLGTIASAIASAFGLDLPAGIPSIHLSNLGLTYGVKARTLTLRGEAEFTPPGDVPWLRGTEKVLVEVGNAPDGKRLSASVFWRIEPKAQSGDPAFQLEAEYGPAGASFYASFDDREHPLRLPALWEALELKSPWKLPESGLWDAFSLRRVTLGYGSRPRNVVFMAETGLGPGALVLDAALTENNRSLTARWLPDQAGAQIGLKDVFGALGIADGGLELPDNVSKLFQFSSLNLAFATKPAPQLQFDAVMAGEALDAFVVVSKPSGKLTVAAGVVVTDQKKLLDLIGTGHQDVLKDALELVPLRPRYLAFSSLDDVIVPLHGPVGTDAVSTTPPANVPAKRMPPPASPLLPGGSLHLKKGATVGAKVVLKDAGNVVFKQLHRVTGIAEIDASVQIAPGSFSVMGAMPGSCTLKVGSEQLTLTDPYLAVVVQQNVPPSVQVGGTMHARIAGKAVDVKAFLAVSESAATANLDVKGLSFPSPQLLPGVRFKDGFKLQLGVDFEPEGMDVGFMGDFYIGDNENEHTGTVAVVLDMIEEIPDPQYFAFSIDKLNLLTMFEAMTGVMRGLDLSQKALQAVSDTEAAKKSGLSMVGGLQSDALSFLKSQYKNLDPILDGFKLEGVDMHYAQNAVTLPDGTIVLPGASFRGTLNLFGLHFYAAMNLSTGTAPSFSGTLAMDPIHLRGILSVTGDGKGITRNKVQVIKPGGPILQLQTMRSPFLHADLEVTLFDLVKASARADIDTKGFKFDLQTSLGSLAHFFLHVELATSPHFRFNGAGGFDVHLKGDIGPIIPGLDFTKIHLDAGMSAKLDILITDKDFKLQIDGSFEFEGASFTMPTLVLDIEFGKLADLAGKIWDHIVDKAEHIFGDLWNGVVHAFEEAGKAIAEVGEKAVAAVADVGKKAIGEVKEVAQKVEDGLRDVEGKLEGVAKATLAEAGQLKAVTEAAVTTLVNEVQKEEQALLDAGKQLLLDAAEAERRIEQEVARDVRLVEHRIEDAVHEAEHAIEEIGRATAAVVNEVLHDAEQFVAGLEHAAEQVVAELAKDAEIVEHEIEVVARAIEEVAERAEKAVVHAAEDVGRFFSRF